MKGWRYSGDMNLTHGGTFFGALDGDSIDAVAVTPVSTAGGPENVFLIEHGTIHAPHEIWAEALETCGYELHYIAGTAQIVDCMGASHGVHTEEGQAMLADALMAHRGLESDRAQWVVRIGKVDPFWSPSSGGAWNPEPDRVLPGNARLDNYVRKHWLT